MIRTRVGNSAAYAALLVAAIAGCRAESDRGPELPEEKPIGSEMLIAPEALAALLAQSRETVVLHVARTRAEYDTARVPGAAFLPLDAIVEERQGIPNELPPVAALDSAFTAVGATDDRRIVVYGEPLAAARAYFTLDVLGHGDHAAVLDGGLPAWRAAGQRVDVNAPPAISPGEMSGEFTPAPVESPVVDAGWVQARTGRATIVLIDARPPEEFSGTKPGEGVARPGHIPGARNLFWKRMVVSDSLPLLGDTAALRSLFTAAGAAPGDTVVTYCRTGMQASYVWFVARYLGYESRMYDGSFLDWARDTSRPVERGEGSVSLAPVTRS